MASLARRSTYLCENSVCWWQKHDKLTLPRRRRLRAFALSSNIYHISHYMMKMVCLASQKIQIIHKLRSWCAANRQERIYSIDVSRVDNLSSRVSDSREAYSRRRWMGPNCATVKVTHRFTMSSEFGALGWPSFRNDAALEDVGGSAKWSKSYIRKPHVSALLARIFLSCCAVFVNIRQGPDLISICVFRWSVWFALVLKQYRFVVHLNHRLDV